MTDTQCLMLGLFIRSAFVHRETLSLSTLFPYLERFTREKNKNSACPVVTECRQARLHVAKFFATIALTQASFIGACTEAYKLIFEFV